MCMCGFTLSTTPLLRICSATAKLDDRLWVAKRRAPAAGPPSASLVAAVSSIAAHRSYAASVSRLEACNGVEGCKGVVACSGVAGWEVVESRAAVALAVGGDADDDARSRSAER